jgi:predicted nucleic acid-binding protein
VLQQRAWQVADQLGWDTTADAEVVALALLQADALVTADAELARAASALVAVVAPEALRVPGAG